MWADARPASPNDESWRIALRKVILDQTLVPRTMSTFFWRAQTKSITRVIGGTPCPATPVLTLFSSLSGSDRSPHATGFPSAALQRHGPYDAPIRCCHAAYEGRGRMGCCLHRTVFVPPPCRGGALSGIQTLGPRRRGAHAPLDRDGPSLRRACRHGIGQQCLGAAQLLQPGGATWTFAHTGTYSHDPVQARAMDLDDIREFRRWHRDAAIRSRDAGFDLVYIYCGMTSPCPWIS